MNLWAEPSVRKVRGGTPQGTQLGHFLFCCAINNIEKAHPTEDNVENEDQSSPEAYREEHRPNVTRTPIQRESSLDHPGWANPMGMRNKINIVRDTLIEETNVGKEEGETVVVKYVDDVNVVELLDLEGATSLLAVRKELKTICTEG